MKNPSYTRSDCSDNATTSPATLKVVILYDLPAAAQQSVRISRMAVDQAGEAGLDLFLWRFDLLAYPEARESATEEVAGADLLFIAINGSGLPDSLRGWLAGTIARKAGSGSAVVILTQSNHRFQNTVSEQLDFIRKSATEVGLDCYAPEPEVEEQLVIAEQRAHATTPALMAMEDPMDSTCRDK